MRFNAPKLIRCKLDLGNARPAPDTRCGEPHPTLCSKEKEIRFAATFGGTASVPPYEELAECESMALKKSKCLIAYLRKVDFDVTG